MRHAFLLALLFFAQSSLSAQVGLRAGYTWYQAQDWQLLSGNEIISEPPGDGFSAGIDYWFRLKNARVEFMPELNYAQSSTPQAAGLETQSHWYSLFFNVNLYPFDFKGDCDCPTFSKQGNALQKGFFIALSPGISYMDNHISGGWGGAEFEYKDTHWAPSIGLGAGVDFGISDLLTLSPFAGFRYFPSAQWPSLTTVAEARGYAPNPGEAAIQQIQAGIRLGWRFNYK